MGAWTALTGGVLAYPEVYTTGTTWTFSADPEISVTGRLTLPMNATVTGSPNTRSAFWTWTPTKLVVGGTNYRNWAFQPETDALVWFPYIEVAFKPIAWADGWDLAFGFNSWGASLGAGFRVGAGQVSLLRFDNSGNTASAPFGTVGNTWVTTPWGSRIRRQSMGLDSVSQSPVYGWDSSGATMTLAGGNTNAAYSVPTLYLNNVAATAATTLICDLKIRCWGNDSLPT